MIRTRKIRSMLNEALTAVKRAEELSKRATFSPDPDVERLLHGAITNALHAAAEIRDESFRHRYGEDGFTR